MIFRNHKKSASFRRRYNNIRRKADEVENVIERRNSMGAKSPNSVRKFNMEVGGSARLIVHIVLSCSFIIIDDSSMTRPFRCSPFSCALKVVHKICSALHLILFIWNRNFEGRRHSNENIENIIKVFSSNQLPSNINIWCSCPAMESTTVNSKVIGQTVFF